MKISLNTIRQYTEVDISFEQLLAKINAQLGGVEEVINLAERYEGAVIVRIISAEKHPDAERLQVCLIDDGGVVADVPRNDAGHVQVVCGAPNAREGILVVWLPPGSTVPASHEDKELFVLGARELRGVLSQGMLAAADELAIGTDHEGILEIDPAEWKPTDVVIEPGASFAKAYGLDDMIIDIENKMFTHRPDCFGQLGVAREIAGIQHKPFKSPAWYVDEPQFSAAEGLELRVANESPDVVPRFMVVALRDITVRQSPLWLRCELVRLGGKPINNIVDITNYVMLLTAQPVHAYDYDKLRGRALIARKAHQGETVNLLNHKQYVLEESDIVIADAEGPVGLAGIMGGGDSEVSESTRNIVLEVATFDMYAVRRSSMRHGIFTDALARFNKGQSSLQNPHVLNLLIQSIYDVASGSQASVVYDMKNPDASFEPCVSDVSIERINRLLGLDLAAQDMGDLLRNVECTVEEAGDGTLTVQVPFWRTDLTPTNLPGSDGDSSVATADIAEEVGRLYGFDRLPKQLPVRSVLPAQKNRSLCLKRELRDVFAAAGANEVLTYSFVHERTLQRAGQDPKRAFKLGNALSPDLQYYRLSVLPSLLEKVHPNIKSGHDEFALYELGKGHDKQLHLSDDAGLPREIETLELVYTHKKPQEGAAYFRVRRMLDHVFSKLGMDVVFRPLPDSLDLPVAAPYDRKRTALIMSSSGDQLGIAGELKSEVGTAFKLPPYVAACSLDLEALGRATLVHGNTYVPLSRFPSITQDLSLIVSNEVPYTEVKDVAESTLQEVVPDNTLCAVNPLSVYQADDSKVKTVTLRVRITNYDRTLNDAQVVEYLQAIAKAAAVRLSARTA